MKNVLIVIAIIFGLTSCRAHNTLPLPKGHAVGYIVEITPSGAIVNSGGRSLIIDNTLTDVVLMPGSEYDFVYEVVEDRGKVIVVKLIGAEYSAGENAKRRAKLLLLMK